MPSFILSIAIALFAYCVLAFAFLQEATIDAVTKQGSKVAWVGFGDEGLTLEQWLSRLNCFSTLVEFQKMCVSCAGALCLASVNFELCAAFLLRGWGLLLLVFTPLTRPSVVALVSLPLVFAYHHAAPPASSPAARKSESATDAPPSRTPMLWLVHWRCPFHSSRCVHGWGCWPLLGLL